MRFTQIDGQSWSTGVAAAIDAGKLEELDKASERAVSDPYAFGSTGNIVTVCFDTNDKGGSLKLPFQTNYTVLYNITNYSPNPPRFNLVLDFFLGKYEPVNPVTLSTFLDSLHGRDVKEFLLFQRREYGQDRDFNEPLSLPTRTILKSMPYRPEGTSINAQIEDVKEKFIRYPEEFLIDPESMLRVEKRTKDGMQIYTAQLDIKMHRGLAGAPALNYRFDQKIRARLNS